VYWTSPAAPGHSLGMALLQEGEGFYFFLNMLWTMRELVPDNACEVDSTGQMKLNCCWKMREGRKKEYCFEQC